MVDALTNSGRKDWGFHEEPNPEPMTGTTGKPPALGWENEACSASAPPAPVRPSYPLVPDLSAFTRLSSSTTPGPFAGVTGSNRTFSDTKSLGSEIFRLKMALNTPDHDDATRDAIRQQIVLRQAEWVAKAKAEGLREPTGTLDPLHAKPSEIANAFLWSAVGGVIPRDALVADGGRSFREDVRDAVVLKTLGFDAMLALHDGQPEKQRELLTRELALRGAAAPEGASLDDLRALRRKTMLDDESRRAQMGLDGHVGTGDQVDAYERDQAIEAMNPGTTLGSLMAAYALMSGGLDVQQMRTMGNAGNAIEGLAGGGMRLEPRFKLTGEPHEHESTRADIELEGTSTRRASSTRVVQPHTTVPRARSSS